MARVLNEIATFSIVLFFTRLVKLKTRGVGIFMIPSHQHTASSKCTEGEVRLVDGESVMEGRVELCRDQKWFTLSADGWGTEEAAVVCGQLGMSLEGWYTLSICC